MQMEQLQKDMIAAMKARDKVRKDAISSLVSAAKKAAIDEGCRDNIPEELVNKVILKEMKSVKEQIDTCPATRIDLGRRGRKGAHRAVFGCNCNRKQRTDNEGSHAAFQGQG